MLAVVKQAYSGVRTCRHIVVVSAVRSGLPVSTRSLDYKPLESTKHALSLFCFLGRRGRRFGSSYYAPGSVLSSRDSQLLPQGGHRLVAEIGKSSQNRMRKPRAAGGA